MHIVKGLTYSNYAILPKQLEMVYVKNCKRKIAKNASEETKKMYRAIKDCDDTTLTQEEVEEVKCKLGKKFEEEYDALELLDAESDSIKRKYAALFGYETVLAYESLLDLDYCPTKKDYVLARETLPAKYKKNLRIIISMESGISDFKYVNDF